MGRKDCGCGAAWPRNEYSQSLNSNRRSAQWLFEFFTVVLLLAGCRSALRVQIFGLLSHLLGVLGLLRSLLPAFFDFCGEVISDSKLLLICLTYLPHSKDIENVLSWASRTPGTLLDSARPSTLFPPVVGVSFANVKSSSSALPVIYHPIYLTKEWEGGS